MLQIFLNKGRLKITINSAEGIQSEDVVGSYEVFFWFYTKLNILLNYMILIIIFNLAPK